MTKREAKQLACSMAAAILERVTPEGCYLNDDGEMLPDAEMLRRESAWDELIEELRRRGGRRRIVR